MTADPGVRVEGLDNLDRTLNAFADGLSDLTDAHSTIAAKVLADARRRSPVRSGRLSSSGFSQGTAQAAVFGFSAAHAPAIMFGVGPRVGLRGPHNIRANMFANAAADVNADYAAQQITAELDDRLGAVKGV